MLDDNYTKPINVVQVNLNRRNVAVHIALNSLIGKADILLVTEPWYDNIGNENHGPAAHVHWQPILPVQPIGVGDRPRVMAYVARRDDFTVTLRSDLVQDLDIQILEVRQHPHLPTLLVNVYNQAPLHDINGAWSACD